MPSTSDVTVKKSRGRPPKVKRRCVRPTALSAATSSQTDPASDSTTPSIQATSSSTKNDDSVAPLADNASSQVPESPVPLSSTATEDDRLVEMGTKRIHYDTQEDATSRKRIRSQSKDDQISETLQSKSSIRAVILPARRSTRQTTVNATQISEGTLRPPGPPSLEAALQIALGNLESETWRYLWSYYEKHQGQPLPTPAAIKEACPAVRRAAEVVDEADRELEQAIDEIMRANAKKKRRGATSTSKVAERDIESTPSPSQDSDLHQEKWKAL